MLGCTVLQLEDAFDLDGDLERQRAHPDGGAGVPAALLAEDPDEEVGGAVGDGRLIAELGIRVHEAEQLDDAGDPVELAELGLDRREHVEGDELRGALTLLDGELAAELADEGRAALLERTVARDEEEVPDAHRPNVVADGGRRLRKLEPEGGER